jgi:hypothetical protein
MGTLAAARADQNTSIGWEGNAGEKDAPPWGLNSGEFPKLDQGEISASLFVLFRELAWVGIGWLSFRPTYWAKSCIFPFLSLRFHVQTVAGGYPVETICGSMTQP